MEQSPHQAPTSGGLGVLVSVDVANVGVLWTRDPDFTWEALNQLEGLLETMVDDLGGTVIDYDGDAFIVRFPSTGPAVMWCARMQEGLLALDWPDALAGTPDEVGVQEMLFGGLIARMAIHAGTLDELQEIVGLAHAGQVLVSGTTFADLTDPTPPDVQVERIGSVSTRRGPTEIFQVTTRLLSRRRFPAMPTRTSGLPAAHNCFVGRQADLADLKDRMRAGARMVNITSADGMGKTRLSLHWARQVEPITNGGAALIRLDETQDTTDLLLATASALGISLGHSKTNSLVDRIGHAIAARGHCVLVFDGFESHLDLDALTTWVRTAQEAQFLVTSTEPLSTELSTHLHLSELSDSDVRSMYLSRFHRKLRTQDRPIHANLVIPPEDLGHAPSAIEDAVGLRSPRWPSHEQRALALRRKAHSEELPNSERAEAALKAVPLLIRMGLPELAHALLTDVEPVFSAIQNQWVSACASTLISGGRLDDASALLQEQDDSPPIRLSRAELALAEDRPEDAIELTARLADTARHAFVRGQALAALDEWEDALMQLTAAANGLDDGIQRAWAWASLGRIHQDLGHNQDAEQCYRDALSEGAEDVHLLARVHHHRFEGATATLRLDEAREHLQQSIDLLQRCGDRPGTADALIHMAVIDLVQRQTDSAQQGLARARQICRLDGLSRLEARTLLTQGIAHRSAGDLGGALDAFVEAAALAEGDHALLGIIHSYNGAAEAAVDAIENAEAAFSTADEHLSESWDTLASTMHDMLLGFVDLARAREAALDDEQGDPDAHISEALNRLARGSSFETRSTPPRGREAPSRINEFRLARLMLDNAIAVIEPSSTD